VLQTVLLYLSSLHSNLRLVKFLSHTFGYQYGEDVQTPEIWLNRGYEEITTLRLSSMLNNTPACEPNAVITHSAVTSDVHHLSDRQWTFLFKVQLVY